MKVLIQHNESERYLAADRTWTTDLNAALDFHAVSIAREALRIARAGTLHVVCYFEELNYCIAVRTAGTPFHAA
jgi:hypothetical protein